jgi:NarL family two-component system response regulator LiaR
MDRDNITNKIRIGIVDDHEMIRRGIADFFRVTKDFELVGEASNGEEAVLLCKKFRPDIILMDLIMPQLNGVEATRQISCKYPKTKIIALSSYDDERLVPAALDAGAVSFIQKNVTMAELADSIRKTYNGFSTMSPMAMNYLISAATKHSETEIKFTKREAEVLQLIVDGKSNSEISKQLVICLPTVKTHVSRILAKLGVSSRSEAIVFSIKNNLAIKPSNNSVIR